MNREDILLSIFFITIFSLLIYFLWKLVFIILKYWFRGIHIGRIDKDSWTKEDYQKWYAQNYFDMFPISEREVKIMLLTRRYHS